MESPDFEPPPDLMQFVLDAITKTGEGRSLDYQVNAIIGTGRAALFTTGITIPTLYMILQLIQSILSNSGRTSTSLEMFL